MNILELQNLNFAYDDKVALQNINLEFEQGQTIAVLGSNGAGKSTLFLMLNGVLQPDSGKILFDGQVVQNCKADLHKLRANVGIVFQNPDDQVFSSNVGKDIAFGLLNQGIMPEVAGQKVAAIAEQLKITHLLDKPTHALSFGQKKIVAIAGILVMRPKVIVLDEPTAGLDPRGVSEVLELLNTIKHQLGMTVILSTHEIDLVPLYCERALVLHEGCAVFSGTTVELFAQPERLRSFGLRLPRIAHLMELLHDKDNLKVDKQAATISQARQTIKKLFNQG